LALGDEDESDNDFGLVGVVVFVLDNSKFRFMLEEIGDEDEEEVDDDSEAADDDNELTVGTSSEELTDAADANRPLLPLLAFNTLFDNDDDDDDDDDGDVKFELLLLFELA
jgi:hypothetical protein